MAFEVKVNTMGNRKALDIKKKIIPNAMLMGSAGRARRKIARRKSVINSPYSTTVSKPATTGDGVLFFDMMDAIPL